MLDPGIERKGDKKKILLDIQYVHSAVGIMTKCFKSNLPFCDSYETMS